MKNFKKSTIVLLAVATVLLLTSVAGSTQAALTYFSEYYSAEVTVANIGVTLQEYNQFSEAETEDEKYEDISWRNYLENAEWDVQAEDKELFTNMLEEDEKLVLGTDYVEKLRVKNSGAIPSYVRVVIKKSWVDNAGNKDTTLSPDFIELGLLEGNNGWVKDEASSTPERTVLYYTEVLDVEEQTPDFTNTIGISEAIQTKVLKETTTETIGDKVYTTVNYDYQYDGYKFNVEVEVDAVQTHNAADAIKSAWGVDVTVDENGSISLQ